MEKIDGVHWDLPWAARVKDWFIRNLWKYMINIWTS